MSQKFHSEAENEKQVAKNCLAGHIFCYCTSVASEMSAQKGIKEKGQKNSVQKFHSEAETADREPETAARAVTLLSG